MKVFRVEYFVIQTICQKTGLLTTFQMITVKVSYSHSLKELKVCVPLMCQYVVFTEMCFFPQLQV